MEGFAVGNVRARSDTGKLFFDFRYCGRRCREQTMLDDTPANRKKLQRLLDRIDAEIVLGQFDYARYFPNSPRLKELGATIPAPQNQATPVFREFTDTWLQEMQAQWRPTHTSGIKLSLRKYILPAFGDKPVGDITKADILQFRAFLHQVTKKNGQPLSATRINHIITPLRMILNEAANRYSFTSPYHGIKSLKVPRTDVEPFSLDEVKLILDTVRDDFHDYYMVRFFTGMRTSEVDGLQWQYVDFERRQILVRQALVKSELIYTKNDGSFRTIDMSKPVYEALVRQKASSRHHAFVFTSAQGQPLNHNNVTKRVWYPLLRLLNLRERRPYQTRHTAATLWLAAGESPEWIARQMGHTTTEMLFRVYSRYVPNLTRQDGSAFERLLKQEFTNIEKKEER
ncbi:DUF3596 domain-containing protein [uncultured Spongiibacter sp.]|uniref:Arm DNA-binding domain-containing protein n=1 Tax=uncultured Spongiibacter sp. TaxID=870896 RepID=UPI0025995D1A|nr:DUF3596 domain-containing protein [uncultured Spongiibacter sp.]